MITYEVRDEDGNLIEQLPLSIQSLDDACTYVRNNHVNKDTLVVEQLTWGLVGYSIDTVDIDTNINPISVGKISFYVGHSWYPSSWGYLYELRNDDGKCSQYIENNGVFTDVDKLDFNGEDFLRLGLNFFYDVNCQHPMKDSYSYVPVTPLASWAKQVIYRDRNERLRK